jgi:hypothetical protein
VKPAPSPPISPRPVPWAEAAGRDEPEPILHPEEPQRTIERLAARVTALEAALEQRSREILLIQRLACKRDLVMISRIRAGLPPLPHGAYEPAFWHESTELVQADLKETLEDLWSSLVPLSAYSR